MSSEYDFLFKVRNVAWTGAPGSSGAPRSPLPLTELIALPCLTCSSY